MRRTRILLLTKGLGRGGAELLIAHAAGHLDRKRFDYEVAFLLPWKNALATELEQAGLRVTCLEGARGVGWVCRLRALVRDRAIDLVHTHSPVPAVGGRLALRRLPVSMVYTEHGLWERYHPATYWANVLTFCSNRHVFAVSDEVRRSIRYPRPLRWLPMPRVETLYHGIDPARVDDWRESDHIRRGLGIPEGVPLVGVVANLRPLKGHRDLLHAAAVVRRALPDVRFVLVGHGPAEEDLRQLTSALGLDGTVVFAGYREDAARVTSACDVFALPSLHEGLSIALVEAMALAKPVVATRVGGLPELVEDGETGLLVPPHDPNALADALVAVLRDADLRERLGEKAVQRSASFDIRRAVARMEDVYKGLSA